MSKTIFLNHATSKRRDSYHVNSASNQLFLPWHMIPSRLPERVLDGCQSLVHQVEVLQSLRRAEGRARRTNGVAGGRKAGGLLAVPRGGVCVPSVLGQEWGVAQVRHALRPVGCFGGFGGSFAESGEREGRAGALPVTEVVAEIQVIALHWRLLFENGREVLPDGEVEETSATLAWRVLACLSRFLVEYYFRRFARSDLGELGVEGSIL